jgi:CDP-diacylglycerol---serine O-phosphatidyltransferase
VREYVTPPNLVTSGSLIAGFVALVLAAQADYGWAAGLVVLAAGFDALDGVIARRGPGEGAFGSKLDSLADLVSFGAVPALTLYLALLNDLKVVGIAACLGFILCGAWRLARFPLVSNPHFFVGLPIPPAGVTAALIAAWGPPPVFALVITVALTLLMVSTLEFPTLSSIRRGRDPEAIDSAVGK